ncbi:MAG TPA: site-specific integrase [Solirubrobacteraceae bacterium]|nr:site-specific integrase [Solirubrobacteraceae bacterium]
MAPPATGLSANFQAHLAGKSPRTQKAYMASLERLTSWARRDELDLIAAQTPDLERFLAEEVRSYASATVHVRRAAIRAFYAHLMKEGIVESNPASGLHIASTDSIATVHGPVEYLADEEIARLRQHALKRGAVSSLAVCMLHETPANLRQIARLSIADFARDARDKPFAILSQNTAAAKTPWPVSQQAIDAVEALNNESPRLISPLTRNPNLALVQREVQEARLSAGVQIPDVVVALKRAHRRHVQQICAHVRLTPRSLLGYQRTLLDKMTPLDRRS